MLSQEEDDWVGLQLNRLSESSVLCGAKWRTLMDKHEWTRERLAGSTPTLSAQVQR